MKCIVCLFSTQVDRDIMTTDRCFGVKVDYHPSLYDGIQYSSEIDGITGHIGHFDLYGVSSLPANTRYSPRYILSTICCSTLISPALS